MSAQAAVGSGPRAAARGAAHGLLAWASYALFETAFCSLKPLLEGRAELTTPSHWRHSALLVAAELIFGALAGAIVGLLLELGRRRQRPETTRARVESWRLQAAVAATVSAAQALSSLQQPETAWTAVFAGALASVQLGAARSRSEIGGRLGVGGPITTAVLLILGSWWIDSVWWNPSAKSLALGGAVLAGSVAVSAFAERKLFPLARPGVGWQRGVALLSGAAGLGIAVLLATTRPEPPERAFAHSHRPAGPNVILVVMDTVRADHTSLYGYGRETTPRLEALARRATLFRHAVSPANWTLPSHASIFTGLEPRAHHARAEARSGDDVEIRPLSRDLHTLAEILAEKGYATAAVAANFANVTRGVGLDQGFQLFDARAPASVLPEQHRALIRFGVRTLLGRWHSTLGMQRITRTAEEINGDVFALTRWLADERASFFLYVNYMDAHDPYVPPAPYDGMFPGRDESFRRGHFDALRDDLLEGKARLSAAESAHLLSQYDGGIAYVDAQVGRLIEDLERKGLYDDTLLIVTADHGEGLGEHDVLGHGRCAYQSELAVPLVVKLPGQREPVVVDTLASNRELFEIVRAAVDASGTASGDAAARALRDRPASQLVVAEADNLDAGQTGCAGEGAKTAFYLGAMKLIESQRGRCELYDLSSDPAETRNLCGAGDAREPQLRAALAQWRQGGGGARSSETLDAESRERLKALGYVR